MFSEFAIRTDGPPTRVAADVRSAMQQVLKGLPISKMTTLADQVDGSTKPERLLAILSGLSGGLGAGLAAIGLYGLLAYTVARRTNEIGVRMAANVILSLPTMDAYPIVFAAVSMLGVALLAAYAPARRASRVDPIEALRQE